MSDLPSSKDYEYLFKRKGPCKPLRSIKAYKKAISESCTYAIRHNTIVAKKSQKFLKALLEIESWPPYVGMILARIEDINIVMDNLKNGKDSVCEEYKQNILLDEICHSDEKTVKKHIEAICWLANFGSSDKIVKEAQKFLEDMDITNSMSFILGYL